MTNKVTFFVVCVEKPKGALASQHSDDSAGCKFFSGGGTERAIAYSMTLVADKVSTMVKSVPDLTSARTYLVELLMTPWTKSSDACKAIVMAIYQQEQGKCITEIGDTSPQWWIGVDDISQSRAPTASQGLSAGSGYTRLAGAGERIR